MASSSFDSSGRSEQIAWAAGLFEGEGCIWMKARTEQGGIARRLVMSSTDRDVLDRFLAVVGCGAIYEGSNARTNPRWKPNWQWTVTAWDDLSAVLTDFLPYLGERRRLAAEAMLASPPIYVRGRNRRTA